MERVNYEKKLRNLYLRIKIIIKNIESLIEQKKDIFEVLKRLTKLIGELIVVLGILAGMLKSKKLETIKLASSSKKTKQKTRSSKERR